MTQLQSMGQYAFSRLASLLDHVKPAAGRDVINMSIGEPKHAVSPILAETLNAHADQWNRYPPVVGVPEFRRAAGDWLKRRYHLPDDEFSHDDNLLPVAGTKEALYLIAQSLVDQAGKPDPVIMMPNPFYMVYLAGAVFGGAKAIVLPTEARRNFLPDLDALDPDELDRCVAFYLCSPSNPQGTVAGRTYWTRLIHLAEKHNFTIVADECYAEIYNGDTPPTGILQTSNGLGQRYENVLAFHSLSKRSNAAGLRSGFIAGDAERLKAFAQLRAYAACVQPIPVLHAAAALWNDEAHVLENRRQYREKMDLAESMLAGKFDFYRPEAGFFLWLNVGDGISTTERLWREAALKVLPGGFTAFGGPDGNPAMPFIRLALVDPIDVVEEGIQRLLSVLGEG